jgi:predicted dehydrogenase
VLVEKPMALTGSEAWELVAEARRRGVHGLVPHGWHYAPFIVHARDLLAAGAVGRIQHVVCHMASAYRDLFDGRAGYGAIDLRGERFEADPATWSGRDGGYALGQLTHLAGLLCWLTDLRAQRVLGRTVTGVTGADIVDAGIVEFEGGALGSISGCGILPAGSRHQLDLRIFGDEGMLQLDVERERCVLRRHDGAHEDVPVEPGAGSYECRRAVNRFIDLIRALEDRNDSPLEASARATELIEALLVSAREGGRAVDVLTSEART